MIDDTDTDAVKKIENDAFDGSGNRGLSAAVGCNGLQNFDAYIAGYKEAFNILIDHVVSQYKTKGFVNTDYIIFPLCYNARHVFELYLKNIITKIDSINQIREVENGANKLLSHNVDMLFNTFQEKSIFDHRYAPYVEKLAPMIKWVAEIDPDGQTFRYPADSQGSMTLSKISLINIQKFTEQVDAVIFLLEDISYLSDDLLKEYKTKTFTTKLSRFDIEEIAQKLPPQKTWGVESKFGDIKEECKEKFYLSNNDFSKAVDIIKTHYTFSELIGTELSLKYLKIEHFRTLFECIGKLDSNEDKKGDISVQSIDDGIDDIEKMLEYGLAVEKCISQCVTSMSHNQLSDIKAIFEIGREDLYAEEYDVLVERYKNNPDTSYLHNLFGKKYARQYMIKGLTTLGQKSIIADIES